MTVTPHQSHPLTSHLGSKPDATGLMAACKPYGPPEVTDVGDAVYWEFPRHGVSLEFDVARTLVCVQFYSAGRDGYAEYAQPLPLGIRFADTRAALEARLGAPVTTVSDASRKAGSPDWLRYRLHGAVIHVELGKHGKVSLVTAMVAGAAP